MKGRAPKRSRTDRGRSGPLLLTERDYAVFELCGTMRYVSLDQIAREHFTSSDRCRRRIRRLFDAGYLAVTLVDSRRPNLISLTKSGVAALFESAATAAMEVRTVGGIRLAAVEHHLGVSDARLYACALGKKRGAPLVGWAYAGSDLSRDLGFADARLAPDGIAQFSVSGERVFVAVEIDLATEQLSVIESKLDRYRQVAAAGRVDALWFVVRSGPQRQENIATLIRERELHDWARVLDHARLVQRPVVELNDAALASRPLCGPNTPEGGARDAPEPLGFNHRHPARDRPPDGPPD